MTGLAYQEAGLCCFPHLLLLWWYLSIYPVGSLSRVPADTVGLMQISPGLITQHGVTEYPNEDEMSPSHKDNFSMQTVLKKDDQGHSLTNLNCFPKGSPNLCPKAC